jgi:serine/threonine protein phosphatase PrpC
MNQKIVQSLRLKNSVYKNYKKENIVTKCAFATKVGLKSRSSENLDSYIIETNLNESSSKSMHFFGVCLGHGKYG